MGRSCLLIAKVSGCSRVPAPPARMMPFIGRDSSRRGGLLCQDFDASVERLLPVGARDSPVARDRGAIQPRIERPARWRGIFGCRDLADGGWDPQSIFCGAVEDRLGEAMPARVRRARKMVRAVGLLAVNNVG